MKIVKALLLTLVPFFAGAQQKISLNLDVYTKKSLMYANQDKVNTANDYHFSSPVGVGAAMIVGVQIDTKTQFQVGLGYTPTKYGLKFSLDSNSFVYKYTAYLNIGTFKLPVRIQYAVSSNFSLVGGISFNYNRNWTREISKKYYYTSVDNYQYIISSDQFATSYIDDDFITFSGDVAGKYRLLDWLEAFAMASFDWGKYPSVLVANQIQNDSRKYLYYGSISPKLLSLSLGVTLRLKNFGNGGKSKVKTAPQPSEKGVNVDILNGVLPQ